jgi:hypothetical protein
MALDRSAAMASTMPMVRSFAGVLRMRVWRQRLQVSLEASVLSLVSFSLVFVSLHFFFGSQGKVEHLARRNGLRVNRAAAWLGNIPN